MNVSQWAQNHRRSILFLFLLLALGGVFAALQLPVSLFPQVAFPRVVVALEAGDQPARQMEMQVTRPVEEAVRSVPGVETVRSTTSRGSAEVSLNFGWGTDMGSAALQVSAAISQILPQLPPGTRADVRRMDPTKLPIIAYSLTSATLTPTQLRDVAEYQLRPLLSSVNGVARVQVKGGAVEEYRVTVNPDKLHAFGLALGDVAKALATENVLKAVGRLEDRYKLYLVVADTRLKTLQQMRETVLASGPGGVVRLEDVATVNVSVEPQWVRVTADGKDAVLLNIYQQPGGNSVQIAKDVQARLEGFPRPAARGRADRQLVRPEHAGHRIGRQRARRHPDRHRPGGAGAAGVPAQPQDHADRHPGGARRARRHRGAAAGAGHELQHHDAGRHGRRRGADRR